MAAEHVDLAAGPESGPHADLLQAEGRLRMVRDRHQVLVRQAEEARSDLERLTEARQSDPTLTGEVEVAEARVEDLRRRALQAEVRIETAEAELDEVREGLK